MKSVSFVFDKAAIGLSLLCAVHCLMLPVILVVLPSLAVTIFGGEQFHLWMLAGVLPISLFALTLGCRLHRDIRVVFMGIGGLIVMLLAALYGHDLFGEVGEKVITLLGASLVALSHVRNQFLCRRSQAQCHCDTNN